MTEKKCNFGTIVNIWFIYICSCVLKHLVCLCLARASKYDEFVRVAYSTRVRVGLVPSLKMTSGVGSVKSHETLPSHLLSQVTPEQLDWLKLEYIVYLLKY